MERSIAQKQNDIDTCGGDWIDRAFGCGGIDPIARLREIVVRWPAGRRAGPKWHVKMASSVLFLPQIQLPPPFLLSFFLFLCFSLPRRRQGKINGSYVVALHTIALFPSSSSSSCSSSFICVSIHETTSNVWAT